MKKQDILTLAKEGNPRNIAYHLSTVKDLCPDSVGFKAEDTQYQCRTTDKCKECWYNIIMKELSDVQR